MPRGKGNDASAARAGHTASAPEIFLLNDVTSTGKTMTNPGRTLGAARGGAVPGVVRPALQTPESGSVPSVRVLLRQKWQPGRCKAVARWCAETGGAVSSRAMKEGTDCRSLSIAVTAGHRTRGRSQQYVAWTGSSGEEGVHDHASEEQGTKGGSARAI